MLSEMFVKEEKVSIIDPLLDKRWDDFVEHHPNGWICHLSDWKKLLESCFSHITGFYLVDTELIENKICAALPIYLVKSHLTGTRLVSIPFATLFDPLYSDENELTKLSNAAIQLCNKYNASFIELRSFRSNGLNNDQRFIASYPYRHHYLELDEEPELLKKRFHRTCIRQRINRAIESKIQLKIGDTRKDLDDFYSLYLMTRKRTNLPPMPYRFFNMLWDIFSSSGKISLLLAQFEKKTIAGIILFEYKDRVSAEFAASSEAYKNISPNHFLFWHAINLAYKKGYSLFDFGRTSINNQPLLDFKRHWGTISIDLPNYIYSRNGKIDLKSSEEKISYKMAKRISKLIPLQAYRVFGEFCYRHLG